MKAFNKIKIEYRTLESLIPYARNPRKNDPVVDKMASGLKEFGFRYPILIKSDGSVVDGHLRLKVAHKLGLREIPIVLEWDEELLGLETEDLKGMGFNMEMTGFEEDDIEKREELKEEAIEVKPFKRTHILLSFSPEIIVKIQKQRAEFGAHKIDALLR